MPISEKTKRMVAQAIARKQWRSVTASEVVDEAREDARKEKRKLTSVETREIEAYVKSEYDSAGAGFSGRF